MRKRQLQEIVNRFMGATPKIIVSARGHDGTCKFCGSPRGMQHSRACPTWGLIHARIECHMLSEGPTKPNEVKPECVMATLEGGADSVVDARTQVPVQNAASQERWPT